MTGAPTKRKWKRWAALALLVLLAPPLLLAAAISSGWADAYLRRAVTAQIARATGGHVDLQMFHLDPWRLSLALGGLTVHGSEPPGTPPLFHADRIEISLQIDSFWGRKISLRSVDVARPSVFIRFEKDGSSNVPVLASLSRLASGSSLREPIFALAVRRLRLQDGLLLWNDVRIPLVAEGGNFALSVDLTTSGGQAAYLGQLRWQQMQFAALRYLPFLSDVSARFSLAPNSLSVTQLVWTIPHASLDAQFSLADFTRPAWTFRYRGGFDFEDLRTILREPQSPSGQLTFNGQGSLAEGKLEFSGSYSAERIGMEYQWFHTRGISSRGTYTGDENGMDVPDFTAQVLGGALRGKVRLDFPNAQFRVDSHVQGVDLAALFAALDNPNLPIAPLHWDGAVDVQAVTTWKGAFNDLDSRGVTVWSPPPSVSTGKIPVNARIDYHYSMATESVSAASSEISTPSGNVQMNGVLGARDSAMDVVFDTQDLVPWDDFINVLRGPEAHPERIAGRFHWQGRITGPLIGPTFAGHVKGMNAAYGKLYWDELDGDMAYSPEFFRLQRASARRGSSSAQLEASFAFNDWSFDPDSAWSLDATLVRTDTDGLQELLGFNYPVHGILSGDFHATGTRANPELTGLFDVINPQAWNWRFDRADGEFAMRRGEISISKAQLRLLPPPASNGPRPAPPPGLLTGNFLYRTGDKQAVFDVTGAALPLESMSYLQTPRLPIGGRLDFQLSGEGPVEAPQLNGTVRLIDFRLGSETLGSFDGKLSSDGNQLSFTADSAISTGELHGNVRVSLQGDYPLSGEVNMTRMDLDPLIIAALHLDALTGPSSVDGQFTVTGSLLRAAGLSVDGGISSLNVEYQHVKLQNTGPIKFHYGDQEIRIEQAGLRAVDSNFTLAGSARFAGQGALDMRLAGAVDLNLFESFLPGLMVSGPAQVDGAFGGTLVNPSITGRVHVANASLRYGDFPVGLSQVNGDFVFSDSRLTFDNVSAQAGGGSLQISGAVAYGNGPLRLDLTARTDQVRVPYPAGMRWLTGGNLRLLGTPQSATLSGRVTVDRLLMEQNFDITSMIGSSETGPPIPSSSAFLRNLQLDIEADASQNASLQWSTGSVQADGTVRLRGTWDRPIILGNIRLLNGQMNLRGNQYRLARGDINFVNPFRADPELNIEATTTIQSYDITVDFTGTASHPVMSQRSDPPLPQSDIITLLAVGQTGQESQLRGGPAAAQTPQAGATTLLSEAVSSQLGGRLQRLFGISHFSVDPSSLAETSAGTNPAMRVTVAQQFAHDLIITYSTDITSTQQQVIQIEYTVSNDLSVVALRDENGTFGIDVVRRSRFK